MLITSKSNKEEKTVKVYMAKKKSKKKKFQENQILEQDENYYFIAGYTSACFPYGVTWEEARKDDLIDDVDNIECGEDEELPFD